MLVYNNETSSVTNNELAGKITGGLEFVKEFVTVFDKWR